MQEIEASFEACKTQPVHATEQKLHPVEVLPLLPDFNRYELNLLFYCDNLYATLFIYIDNVNILWLTPIVRPHVIYYLQGNRADDKFI